MKICEIEAFIGEISSTCYVCGKDLTRYYKQDCLDSPPTFLQMMKWNGARKPLCGYCYKAAVEGLKVFRERNPTWNPIYWQPHLEVKCV